MSKSKFEKAVDIVQALPKDGPVKPSTEDRLYVSLTVLVNGVIFSPIMDHPVLQVLQARYAQHRKSFLDKLTIVDISYSRRCQHWSSRSLWLWRQSEVVSTPLLVNSIFPTHVEWRDAWNSVKGTLKEEAEKKYVEKLIQVLSIYLEVSWSIRLIPSPSYFKPLKTMIPRKTWSSLKAAKWSNEVYSRLEIVITIINVIGFRLLF